MEFNCSMIRDGKKHIKNKIEACTMHYALNAFIEKHHTELPEDFFEVHISGPGAEGDFKVMTKFGLTINVYNESVHFFADECVWIEKEEGSEINTDCGQFITSPLSDYPKVKYCFCCGKKIRKEMGDE